VKTLAAKSLPADMRDKLKDLADADPEVRQAPEVKQALAKTAPEQEGQQLSRQEIDALSEAIQTLRQPEPQASIEKDRFDLRGINEQFQKNYVKIKDPGSDIERLKPYSGVEFSPGDVVERSKFEAERQLRENKRIELLDKNKFDAELVQPPTDEPVTVADGEPHYFTLIVLPKVAYTIPLILAALSLWLAWRLVNVPVFADFLIATEAELNKVSWTTRRRLVQDTIVVLTTVVLMAAFLFAADFLWSKLLTGIGVLQPPPASSAPAEPKW
jgi:preprotein translocase SecE subunit